MVPIYSWQRREETGYGGAKGEGGLRNREWSKGDLMSDLNGCSLHGEETSWSHTIVGIPIPVEQNMNPIAPARERRGMRGPRGGEQEKS
jgi:hypothetical protein